MCHRVYKRSYCQAGSHYFGDKVLDREVICDDGKANGGFGQCTLGIGTDVLEKSETVEACRISSYLCLLLETMTENPTNTALSKEGNKIVELARNIIDGVARIQAVFYNKGHPFPSFKKDARQGFPLEALDSRDLVLDVFAEL
ncbi:hypothetical protein K449DRAFT_432480 [Hypoxylon sp. EC38]|nr:hypothetical protein K449DRAFT_432480 [Hypoxylon sp. EC38]